MRSHHFQSMAVALTLLGVGACMGTETNDLTPGQSPEAATDAPATVEPTRIALQTAASAEPGENDGSCENGAGVILSALGDAATLTVYVVAPAEIVTFERTTLRLRTQQAAGEVTEVAEFETVTLEAGESRSFSSEVDGKLMNVAAEVDAMVL